MFGFGGLIGFQRQNCKTQHGLASHTRIRPDPTRIRPDQTRIRSDPTSGEHYLPLSRLHRSEPRPQLCDSPPYPCLSRRNSQTSSSFWKTTVWTNTTITSSMNNTTLVMFPSYSSTM